MTKAGIRFRQKYNCFTCIEDLAEAQRLLDTQLTTDWPALLQRWAELSNPVENTFLQKPVPYYWITQESEYASDILFHEREDLSRLYPQWVGYAYSILKSGSLLRYLDYRVRKEDTPCQSTERNIKTTVKAFSEGTCVRQRVQGNVLKMYNKAPNVLRVENTVNGHQPLQRILDRQTGQEEYPTLPAAA